MRAKRETAVLTVAAIRRRDSRVTEYLFNERQQIFTVPAARKARVQLSTQLTRALRQGTPVRAVLDPLPGVIRRIEPLSPDQTAEFERERPPLEKPDRIVRLDVAAIDPATFNVVDRYLKFPTFKLCTKIVPNYKTAKKIFDFCAEQSCHLGTATVTPCIPFQYVRDGCYARAHKMRKIITQRYGYCCEKVFSFANQGNDTLAVRADKWGGCCVTWWYHVTPLLRVRFKIGSFKLCPGAGDRPGHVRQARPAELLAHGPGERLLRRQRPRLGVLDPARLGVRAGQLSGHGVLHRPGLHRDQRHAHRVQEPHDVPVDPRELTVANIRESPGADVVVVFLESARFYTLPREHPRFDQLIQRLRRAMAGQRRVRVRVTAQHGDVIDDVQD